MSKQIQKNINQAKKEVWKNLKEISRSQKEADRRIKETDRQMQETDRRIQKISEKLSAEMAASRKEADKRLDRLDALFTSQWGKLMEALVEGDLLKLLKEKGITVDDTTTNMKGHHNEEDWEIDILASNGEEIVIVEVKTTLKVQDVKDFIYKLNKFTTWKPKYKDDKMYGAVAYLKAHHSSIKYAEKQGLFVIRATGSSASIINKKNFKPKIFS